MSIGTVRGNPGQRFGVSIKGIDGAANATPVDEDGYASARRRSPGPNREETMFNRLLPRNTDFFDYFERVSALTIEVCGELLSLLSDQAGREKRRARIKEIEHAGDDVTHQCLDALHRTFITPIDRYDIHHLIKAMDDILDSIDAIAARICMYGIAEIRPEALDFTRTLHRAIVELDQAVRGLRNMKHADAITKRCIAVHQCENDGDALLQTALTHLFKEGGISPITVIMWKEMFERLEGATDLCEDVANIIEGVIIEAS